jgi:hypothetical protein
MKKISYNIKRKKFKIKLTVNNKSIRMQLIIQGCLMQSFEELIVQMNLLLDRLVDVARQLSSVSKQVISEEQLAPLQEEQDGILKKLEEIDTELQQTFASELTPAMHQQLTQKLEEFKAFNQEYIDHLKASHGLIQFELRRLHEEENISIPSPRQLKKDNN